MAAEDKATTRIKIGYVDGSLLFEPNNILADADALFLPGNQDYQYPWIGIEYLERKLKTMYDIYLINQTEDINLGWHHEFKLGLELKDVSQGMDMGYHVTLQSSKGFEINDG